MTTVRERILSAAQQHFRQVDASNARVQQICAVAGVSRTSFYREFRNVDGVIVALALKRWTQAATTAINEVSALPGVDAWRYFILFLTREMSARWASNGECVIHLTQLMYRDGGACLQEMIEVMRPFIEQGQRAGAVRTDVRVEDVADWLLRQAWSMASVPFPGPDHDSQRGQYLDAFVLPALLRPEGEAGSNRQLLERIEQMACSLDRIEARLPGST